MTSSSQQDFDVWKREATKLERNLEDKVAKYQQLAQRLNQTTSATGGSDLLANDLESGSASTTTSNLLSQVDALHTEIQRHLTQWNEVLTTRLQPAAERSGKSQHLLLVKRYREILYDFTQDFKKTSVQIQRKRQQLELFRGATSAQNGAGSKDEDEAMQHLLRERTHISNSLSTSAAVINQASEIHSNLQQQGNSLRNNVQAVVGRILSNIPQANTLISNIRRRRNRDDMIVAAVIAACVLFTLYYLFG